MEAKGEGGEEYGEAKVRRGWSLAREGREGKKGFGWGKGVKKDESFVV